MEGQMSNSFKHRRPFSASSTVGCLAITLALAVLAVVSLTVTHSAKADTYSYCAQPSVSDLVRAADGRVYVRGHTAGCSNTYRITMTLKKNGVADASNTQYYWSGDGGAGVFSAGGCVHGAGYQGVALVSSYWNGAWHDSTYATTGAPKPMC
jgi:hypothetical protein